MAGALEEVFPQARYQRCTVHFYRNVFSKAPKQKRTLVAKMPKAMHAQESKEAAGLGGMRLGAAARVVREGCLETLTYTDFPMRHWTRIRTSNAIGRLNREIRRRTRAVGTFPDGRSALMPATARLKYIAECEWGKRRYLDISLLENEEVGAWSESAWSRTGGDIGGQLFLRKILDGTCGGLPPMSRIVGVNNVMAHNT